MSRKDPRKVMVIPLSPTEWRQLRDRARGRSLGDAARRLVSTVDFMDVDVAATGAARGAATGAAPGAAPGAEPGAGSTRALPVQLPAPILVRLDAAAQMRGLLAPDLLHAAIARALSQSRPE